MYGDLTGNTIDKLATAIGAAIGAGPTTTLLPRVAKVTGSSNTAIALVAYNADRVRLAIQNLSDQDAHVYPDNVGGPTAATIIGQGIRLAPYAMLSLSEDEATTLWHGACQMVSADFRIMEVYPE